MEEIKIVCTKINDEEWMNKEKERKKKYRDGHKDEINEKRREDEKEKRWCEHHQPRIKELKKMYEDWKSEIREQKIKEMKEKEEEKERESHHLRQWLHLPIAFPFSPSFFPFSCSFSLFVNPTPKAS